MIALSLFPFPLSEKVGGEELTIGGEEVDGGGTEAGQGERERETETKSVSKLRETG